MNLSRHEKIRIVCVILGTGLIVWELHSHMLGLIQWVSRLGPYAVIGFFILYCFCVLCFLPIEPVILASGAIFGWYYGFLINLLSAVVSAVIGFMLSRHLGINWTAYRKRRLPQILKRFESFGWKSLAMARLTPFLPCALVNYGYGLTNMRLVVYTMTSFLFFIPYKLIVTYVGSFLG